MEYATFKSILNFVSSEFYKEWKSYLAQVFKYSREPLIYKSPEQCMNIQLSMLENLEVIENRIIDLRNKNEIKNTQDIVYLNRVRNIIKDIADGLAWRLLGFNRPLMRILSQNQSPGFLKMNESGEVKKALEHVQEGKIILINDITNILRIGDLIEVKENYKPHILEIKKSGNKELDADKLRMKLQKGGDLENQAKRMLEVDDSIIRNEILIGENAAKIGILDIPINTYHKEVLNILENCEINGRAESFVDKFLFVRAIKLNWIGEINNLQLPFNFLKSWTEFSSFNCLYKTNGEHFRNKIPYANFPFPNEIVIQLLSGEIILESYINLNYLMRYFEKKGWQVKGRNLEDLYKEMDVLKKRKYGGPKIFKYYTNTSIFTLSLHGFNYEVPIEKLGMVCMDFLKPDIISNTANAYMEKTKFLKEDGYQYCNYSKEETIWS